MNRDMSFTIDYDPREEQQQNKQQLQHSIQQDLNTAQQEAVLATDGPVLVLAGAEQEKPVFSQHALPICYKQGAPSLVKF